MEYYFKAIHNYSKFTGRSTREDFWMFQLFNCLIFIGLFFIAIGAGSLTDSLGEWPLTIAFIFMGLYFLFILMPSIALRVRRLHDIGLSGWLYLLIFVPLGGLALFVMSCIDSERRANKYGPSPKYETLDVSNSVADQLVEDF